MKLAGICLMTALGLAACGGGDDDVTIAETPLAGKIGGQPWTFVQGETDDFLSEGEDDFFTSFYAGTFDACGFGAPAGNYLLGAVPKVVGEYDLGSARNFTFVIDGEEIENLATFQGKVVVDEVTDTTVKGGLHATYDGDNEVDGTFQLTICADDGF